MLPIGSIDDHARYLSKYNYRYYCVSCIRSIESVQRLEKCVHCNSSNLILLMEKEVKEKVPWQARLMKLLRSFQKTASNERHPFFMRASKEELPTR